MKYLVILLALFAFVAMFAATAEMVQADPHTSGGRYVSEDGITSITFSPRDGGGYNMYYWYWNGLYWDLLFVTPYTCDDYTNGVGGTFSKWLHNDLVVLEVGGTAGEGCQTMRVMDVANETYTDYHWAAD
jgi:hypothetical protein